MKRLNVFLLPLLALSSTISLGATQLQVSQTANPTGVVGVPYSFNGVVAVNGGVSPYTYTMTAGALPPGLKLSGDNISGTPTASATPFNFTITVKDSSSPKQTGSAPVTLNVFPSGSVVITTGSLPTATIGVAYSQTMQASGGVKPYTWSLRGNSTLPAGLKLNGATVSGTPTAQATSAGFTIQVVDSSNTPPQNTAQMPLTIAVQAPLKITTTTLPSGMVGSVYSAPLNATGGTMPYAWSIASGSSAPAGLTLSSTGSLSGTPTTATGSTPVSVKVQVKDASTTAQTATATLSLQIAVDPLSITTKSLAAGVVGSAYSAQLVSSGGTGKVTWKLANASSLVAGLTLSTSGAISGTPTAPTSGAGNFSVVATDSASTAHTATATLSLQIAADPLSITTKSLAAGVVGSAYSAQLASSGGTGKVTWKLANASSLVAGLTLSTSGAISGTPTAPTSGAGNFSVVATDSASTAHTATAQIIYTINPAKPTISSLSPNSIAAGASGFQMTITGANFTSTSIVKWNSTTLSSSNPSATQLTATVPGSLIATAGSASVTVTTAGGTSAGATFTISPASTGKCSADGTGNAKLKGGYAFEFSQIYLEEGNAPGFILGAFAADGKGNISGGIYDVNSPALSSGDYNGSFTGTYAVGADDRGVMTVSATQDSGPNQTYSYCIALDSISSGAAGSGWMVEDDDDGNVSSGSFYAQGGSNFTLNSAKGSWAFGMQGGNFSGGQVGRMAAVGFLTLDGSGKLTAGQTDVSIDNYNSGVPSNTFVHQTGLTGSYTLASSGRGTMSVTVPSGQIGAGTSHLVFYVAGPNHILQMNADPGGGGNGSSPVMAGEGYLRTTTTFNKATLSGTSVYVSNAISETNSTGWDQRKIEAGILTWDGAGNLAGNGDVNDAGTVIQYPNNALGTTYAVDTNGRVTAASSDGHVFYLVGPNQGFGIKGSLKAPLLYFEKQTVPTGGFKLSSFSGAYSAGSLWYDLALETALTGEITANGAGILSGTVDENTGGDVAVDQAIGAPYTAAANGRFLLVNGSTPVRAIYLVSPTKAYMIDISTTANRTLFQLNHQ